MNDTLHFFLLCGLIFEHDFKERATMNEKSITQGVNYIKLAARVKDAAQQ